MSDAPTRDQLVQLERDVRKALDTQDSRHLDIVGYGEVSVALGWPAGENRYVCKRTPPGSQHEIDAYAALIASYIDQLAGINVAVVPTDVVSVEREGGPVAYIVQPKRPAHTIADTVLRNEKPRTGHPLIEAIGEVAALATARMSVDAQASNWAWADGRLELLDVGSPFLWDEDGALELNIEPFLPFVPLPLRSAVRKELLKATLRWQHPRGVAIDFLAGLYRSDLAEWVPPAAETLNTMLEPDEPLTAAEAEEIYREDLKMWPRLTKLQKAQRLWQTRVRRRPYEFFIADSYSGEID
ncbi:MAG: DUF6206 family protein [Actinomycetota bacterium]